MNGSRQHAPHYSADLHQAAVGTGDNMNARVNAHAMTQASNAHEQMPPPGLCSCSSCRMLPAVPIPDALSCLPLSALGLSTHLFLLFRRADVFTVGQLLEMDLETLLHPTVDETSIQEVIRQVEALYLLEPVRQVLAEESVPAEANALPADSGHSSSSYDEINPVVLEGHRYAWTVSIDDSGWSKREQWYLDVAPGTFPYPAGTLVEHNAQLYVIKSAGTSMLRVSTLQEDELEDEDSAASEPPVEREPAEAELERRASRQTLRVCFEVSVSCLPLKYRDRFSRRQRTCWVETPEPSSVRPGYFLTRIGSTPDKVRAKGPVFLTEQEAAVLVPVAEASSPIIKVAPAFLLPEDVRRAVFPGIAHPADLWGSPSEQLGAHDAQRADQQAATGTSVKVPVPEHLSHLPIKRLELSLALEGRLRLAGITRVGQLLEMQEESFRALSIGDRGMREIARRLEAVQALPSREALVYEECYLHISALRYTDEQQDTWCMAYVSVFPDRLSGWRSGPVYTVWLLQQHVDLAMNWDRSLSSLDTHTLRVRVNEHVREQGAVAPPLRAPKPRRAVEEQVLSASKNIYIRLEATDGLLDALPPGEEKRRYQERRADQLFGLQQEEWLALGRQAAEREREQHARAGHHQKAFCQEQVAACIGQVEDWYGRLSHKPRILGLCGVFVEDQVPNVRTYTVREKGRSARKVTRRWTEPVPRLVGYHLVVGAPLWVAWPENWVQKPCEEQTA